MKTAEELYRILHKDIYVVEMLSYRKDISVGEEDIIFQEQSFLKLDESYSEWRYVADRLALKLEYVLKLVKDFTPAKTDFKSEFPFPFLVFRFDEGKITKESMLNLEGIASEYRMNIPGVKSKLVKDSYHAYREVIFHIQ